MNHKRTLTNRFYLGNAYYAECIENGISNKKVTTLPEAVNEARARLANNPQLESVIIVEIKYIVSKTKPVLPSIIIEDVR